VEKMRIMCRKMSNRLYSKDELAKITGPTFTPDFLEWLWYSGIGILLNELVIYFIIVPEARLSPEHQMLMWLFLPLTPAFTAVLLWSPTPKPKQTS
jgi:hypothetical protein